MSGKATPQEKVEEILRMNDNGCFVSEIVKKTGVIESTVTDIIYRNGGKVNRAYKTADFNPQFTLQENAEMNNYKSVGGYCIALKRNKIDYKEQREIFIKQRVIELYNMGKTVAEISRKIVKIDNSKTKSILLSEGIDIYRNSKVSLTMYAKQRHTKPETEEMQKEILRLTMKGFSGEEIYNILNKKVSRVFIYRIKRKYTQQNKTTTICLPIREIREKWEDRFDYMMPMKICKEMGEEYNKSMKNKICDIKRKNLQKKKNKFFSRISLA